MDPGLPVPPPLYGGHERLVHLFAEEYHRLGHEVSLFVGPGSTGPGAVHVFGRNGLNRPKWDTIKEIITGWSFLALNHKKYDLIHNFGRLIYLMPILNKRVKKIENHDLWPKDQRNKYQFYRQAAFQKPGIYRLQ
jgi:hypothetical protein